MNFIELPFIQRLGIAMLVMVLLFGFIYWVRHFFKRTQLGLALKYKVFRSKKNPQVVEVMEELTKQGFKGEDAYKELLCNQIKPKMAREMIYVQELLKGGKKEDGRR